MNGSLRDSLMGATCGLSDPQECFLFSEKHHFSGLGVATCIVKDGPDCLGTHSWTPMAVTL